MYEGDITVLRLNAEIGVFWLVFGRCERVFLGRRPPDETPFLGCFGGFLNHVLVFPDF
jgi:hypothetical protein